MKKKCLTPGCYEPADCWHGYCAGHCPKRHPIRDHHRSRKPTTSVPHIGVEIEVQFSCTDLRKRVLPLKAHYDGSLETGSNVGAEFKILAPAKQIAKKATRVLRQLWERKAKITPKCGLHVHLDVRQATPARITALLDWAQLTQEVWFGLVPPSRRENHYCTRITKTNRSQHYTWMNLTRHKTLEVRLHAGTLNPFKLEGWLVAMEHLQHKLLDETYTFPAAAPAVTDETGSQSVIPPEAEAFWAVFADCPKAGKEYLQARSKANGQLRDFAFATQDNASEEN